MFESQSLRSIVFIPGHSYTADFKQGAWDRARAGEMGLLPSGGLHSDEAKAKVPKCRMYSAPRR